MVRKRTAAFHKYDCMSECVSKQWETSSTITYCWTQEIVKRRCWISNTKEVMPTRETFSVRSQRLLTYLMLVKKQMHRPPVNRWSRFLAHAVGKLVTESADEVKNTHHTTLCSLQPPNLNNLPRNGCWLSSVTNGQFDDCAGVVVGGDWSWAVVGTSANIAVSTTRNKTLTDDDDILRMLQSLVLRLPTKIFNYAINITVMF